MSPNSRLNQSCRWLYDSLNYHKSLVRLYCHYGSTVWSPAPLTTSCHAHDRCCIVLASPSQRCGISIRKTWLLTYGRLRTTASLGCDLPVFLLHHLYRCGSWHSRSQSPYDSSWPESRPLSGDNCCRSPGPCPRGAPPEYRGRGWCCDRSNRASPPPPCGSSSPGSSPSSGDSYRRPPLDSSRLCGSPECRSRRPRDRWRSSLASPRYG